MASRTITAAPRFAAGSTLSAWPAINVTPGGVSGVPVAAGVVDAAGRVAFSGLTADGRYVAGVSSAGPFISFMVDPEPAVVSGGDRVNVVAEGALPGMPDCTAAMRAAFARAVEDSVPLYVPAGIFNVDTTGGDLFPIGTTQVVVEGAGSGNVTGGVSSGSRIVRTAGASPLVSITGTGDAGNLRGHGQLRGIEFNGGGGGGDVAVFSRTNELLCDDVRFTNATGRLLRTSQSWNNRWTDCFFTDGGSGRAVPATVIDGIDGDGFLGNSAINHFTGCEWEGNTGTDVELAGSADGTAGPALGTFFVGCKWERQIAGATYPIFRLTSSHQTEFAACELNVGGDAGRATASVTSGSTAMTLASTAPGWLVAGQTVVGPGMPSVITVRAVTTSASNAITPEAGSTFPLNSAPVSGIATGQVVTGPGIPAGTTVTAVSRTSITLSANATASGTVTLNIGGLTVSSVAGTAVTLSGNATSTNATQTYAFGAATSRLVEIPSTAPVYGSVKFAGCDLQHAGNPDFFIVQESGVVNVAGCSFISTLSNYPTAFWRVGNTVDQEAAKWAACDFGLPTRSFADERANGGFSIAAYDMRRVPIEGASAGVVRAALGPTQAWQLRDAQTDSLYFTFRVPPNVAKAGNVTFRITCGSPTAGSNVRWQLAFLQTGAGSSLAGGTPVLSNTTQGNPATAAGGVGFVDVTMTYSATGNAIAPNITFAMAITRLGADAADTLADVINVLSVDAFWTKSA